ncbi:MAG: DUF4007 family protein [Gammaproteobacteria bacterium]|nr:DUF4007 family protein [Gammaproteobacteria bacterium]
MEQQLTLLDGMAEPTSPKGLPEQSAHKVTVGNFALRLVGGGCRVSIRENLRGYPSRHLPVKLTGSNTAFGRHESFPLRFGWITKGLRALADNPKIFTSENATVELGVGKNMVNSIRYWLQATQMARRDPKTNMLKRTTLAEIVFGDDGDPYLEDEGTIWLLHWLLATNPKEATAVYWFFNHFHKPAFTTGEVVTGLTDFAKRGLSSRTSVTTLKGDAQLLLRMYARTAANARIALEDVLDSPLAMLDLQERLDTKSWRAAPMDRAELPSHVFAFAIAELFEHAELNQFAITDLMYSGYEHCAPGAVFRMTEDGLVSKLEALCEEYPNALRLDRTAGIFQLLKMAPLNPLEILKAHYAPNARLAA